MLVLRNSHVAGRYCLCSAVRSGLPHARRMGAASGDLAGLAAPARRLAGQVRTHPLGLRRDHPSSASQRGSSHPRQRRRRPKPSGGDPRQTRSSIVAKSLSGPSPRIASGRAITARCSSIRRTANSAMVNFAFNGWAKYRQLAARRCGDGQINDKLREEMWQPESNGRRVVLEGGSIEVNGAGIAADHGGMSTQRRARAQSRLGRGTDYERLFADYLGVRKVLWLGAASPATIRTATSTTWRASSARARWSRWSKTTRGDVNYEPLQENLRATARHDGRGRPAVGGAYSADAGAAVVRRSASAGQLRQLLHRQRLRSGADVQRSPTTAALWTSWRACFPRRTVIGIHAVDLVWGLGTLHCLTQQEPESVAANHLMPRSARLTTLSLRGSVVLLGRRWRAVPTRGRPATFPRVPGQQRPAILAAAPPR